MLTHIELSGTLAEKAKQLRQATQFSTQEAVDTALEALAADVTTPGDNPVVTALDLLDTAATATYFTSHDSRSRLIYAAASLIPSQTKNFQYSLSRVGQRPKSESPQSWDVTRNTRYALQHVQLTRLAEVTRRFQADPAGDIFEIEASTPGKAFVNSARRDDLIIPTRTHPVVAGVIRTEGVYPAYIASLGLQNVLRNPRLVPLDDLLAILSNLPQEYVVSELLQILPDACAEKTADPRTLIDVISTLKERALLEVDDFLGDLPESRWRRAYSRHTISRAIQLRGDMELATLINEGITVQVIQDSRMRLEDIIEAWRL